jgi:hypothetical protein
VVAGTDGELRFAPDGDLRDLRGARWRVDGDLDVLGLSLRDGLLIGDDHPDALGRVWSALNCPAAGDVLLSAALGHEFLDWGGAAHLGGGSHGSLRREDSLCPLLWCGTGPGSASERAQWSLRDVEPMVRAHFGL